MNKKQINHAADDYSADINAKRLNIFPEAIRSHISPEYSSDDLADAFNACAEWRINSVWHDMKAEEPQVYGEYENKVYPQIPCLVYGKLSTGIGYGVRYWNVK